MRIDLNIMGHRIRETRKKHRMTAEDLSSKIGIAVESLGHIECGNRGPSLATLCSIAEVLDVSLDYLTGRTLTQEENILQEEAEAANLTPKQEEAMRKLFREIAKTVKELS